MAINLISQQRGEQALFNSDFVEKLTAYSRGPSHALQKLSYVSTYEENELEIMTKIFEYLLKIQALPQMP